MIKLWFLKRFFCFFFKFCFKINFGIYEDEKLANYYNLLKKEEKKASYMNN